MLEVPVELAERRYSISLSHGLSRLLPDPLEGLLGPDGERFKGRSTLEESHDAFLDTRLACVRTGRPVLA